MADKLTQLKKNRLTTVGEVIEQLQKFPLDTPVIGTDEDRMGDIAYHAYVSLFKSEEGIRFGHLENKKYSEEGFDYVDFFFNEPFNNEEVLGD